MDFFKKLSDPVYFSRLSSRFIIGMSIFSFLLFGYLIYTSVENGRPAFGFFFALIILMNITNFVKAIKMLKRLRGVSPKL